MTQTPDKPDWIDEAAEEIMLMTDRVAVPSAGFTTRKYCEKASDIIREHFLKATPKESTDDPATTELPEHKSTRFTIWIEMHISEGFCGSTSAVKHRVQVESLDDSIEDDVLLAIEGKAKCMFENARHFAKTQEMFGGLDE